MIKVSCKQCGKRYSTDEKYVGRKMKCRQCGATFEIRESSPPKPRSKPAKAAAKAAKAPPPKKKKKKKAPQRPQRDALAELESIETDVQAAAPAPPGPKKKGGSLAPLIIGIIAVVFGLVAIGGGFIPTIGAYVAYTAAALALVLGLVGLIMALTGPSKGMVWNIGGVSLALLAVAINLLMWLLASDPAPPPQVVTITKPAPVVEQPAEPPPEDTSVEDAMAVLRQSFEALKNGDADGAMANAIMPENAQVADMARAAVTQMAAMINGGQIGYDILEGTHQGDWVLIVTSISVDMAGQKMDMLQKQMMLKTEDQWKIISDMSLAHPQVAPYMNEDYQALDQWYKDNEASLQEKYGVEAPKMDPSAMAAMAQAMGVPMDPNAMKLPQMPTEAATSADGSAAVDKLKQALLAANQGDYTAAGQLMAVDTTMAGGTAKSMWDSATRNGSIKSFSQARDQPMAGMHQISLTIHYTDGSSQPRNFIVQESGGSLKLMMVQ